MRIKTQFVIAMALFSGILVVVTVSAIMTNKKVEQAGRQERIASAIAQWASELGHLSNDYLIYRESQQLVRWRSRFAAFSEQVASLNVDKPEQQALVASIRSSKDRMKAVFDSAAATTGRLPGNVGEAPNPEFLQVSWSRMAIQSQALAADALRLSKLLSQERDKLTDARTILLYAMIGLFGLFLLAGYLFTYQRILKSIATLRAGAAVIGSGNLDFMIEERKNDEIGELSHAMNLMAYNLKAVTASRVELEREIDERKRAEEALKESGERYRSLFENLNSAFLLADPIFDEEGRLVDLKYLMANPATSKHLKKAPEEMVGRKLSEVWHYLGRNPIFEIYERVLSTGESHKGEFFLPAPNRYYDMAVYRPTPGRLALVMSDITERKMAEEAIRQQTEKLTTANKELESFAYSISHDLRAPLRAIDGYSRMLITKMSGKLNEDEKRRFEVIRNNTSQMGKLIDDILAFSRLGGQAMSLVDIDMAELVNQVWGELLTINPGRKMSLKMNTLPTAFADTTLIRQVLANLLSNAFKFTRKTEGALIEIGGDIRDLETVYFVRDNGAGFDMQYYNKLFGVFQRLHSQDEYEGTGAGLAIVQRIINRHGGRVWAEGEVDKGATFYFTLPLQLG